MKKLLLATAVALTFAVPAHSQDINRESVERHSVERMSSPAEIKSSIAELRQTGVPAINAACSSKWGTDYDMQLYCRNKQLAALETLASTLTRAYELGRDPAAFESVKMGHL
jgi:hypothetical protein